MKAQAKWKEELAGFGQRKSVPGKGPMINGLNGHHINGGQRENQLKIEDVTMTNDSNLADDEAIDEPTQPPPLETKDSLTFKLTLLEMYFQRVEKRLENKNFMFDRGLLEYKKVSALHLLETFSDTVHLDASC